METAGRVVVDVERYSWIIVCVSWETDCCTYHRSPYAGNDRREFAMFAHVYSLIKQFATAWKTSERVAADALQLIDSYFSDSSMNAAKRFETVEYHAYNASIAVGENNMAQTLMNEYGVLLLKGSGTLYHYCLMDVSDGSTPERLHLLTDGTVFVVVETEC